MVQNKGFTKVLIVPKGCWPYVGIAPVACHRTETAGTKSETRREVEIPNLRLNARPFGKFRVFVIISLRRPMSMKYIAQFDTCCFKRGFRWHDIPIKRTDDAQESCLIVSNCGLTFSNLRIRWLVFIRLALELNLAVEHSKYTHIFYSYCRPHKEPYLHRRPHTTID